MNPFKLLDRILEQAIWSEPDAKYCRNDVLDEIDAKFIGGKDGRELETY